MCSTMVASIIVISSSVVVRVVVVTVATSTLNFKLYLNILRGPIIVAA